MNKLIIMKARKVDKDKSGIYCIKNIITNKMYIGKAKCIFNRIISHKKALNANRKKCENDYFINAWNKYGEENFEYYVLEYIDFNEILLKERELYWMKKLKTTNYKYGYNLRMDSSTNMIVHKETRKKMSRNLKKQWADGIRKDHSKKLTMNWKTNESRRKEQSLLLTNILTKYIYKVTNILENTSEYLKYNQLKILNLENCLAQMHRKKSNLIKFKGFTIEKIIIKDIVQL